MTMKKVFVAILLPLLLAGCGRPETVLVPAEGAQKMTAEAARQKCRLRAKRAEPRVQSSIIETYEVYVKVFGIFTECAREHGYEAKCGSVNQWMCGLELAAEGN